MVKKVDGEKSIIHSLCLNNSAFGTYVPGGISRTRPHISYNGLLQDFFLMWPLRGSFTSIEEMLFALKISEDDFEKGVTKEKLLDFIQFTLNAVRFLNEVAENGEYLVYKATDGVGKAIWENGCYVAEKLGTEIKKRMRFILFIRMISLQ